MSGALPLPVPTPGAGGRHAPGNLLRPAWAEISLAALQHNLRIAVENARPARLMAVVKSNAYGHGVEPVTRALLAAGADELGVATADEAVALRAMKGVERVPILVMGATLPEEGEAMQQADVAFSVGSAELLRHHIALAEQRGTRARVHVQLDTGIGRDGFRWDDFRWLDIVRGHPEHLEGLFTHFSCSDSDDPEKRDYTTRQIERFDAAIARAREAGLNPTLHAANSAALVSRPETRYDVVRPGIMLYGIDPFGQDRSRWGLRPVLRFISRLAAVRDMKAGDPVSYDRLWTVPTDRKIGVVPAGYGDGYPVAVTNLSHVLIRGRRFPTRGRVCMDQFMVDLGDLPDARTGEEVVIYGPQGEGDVPLEEIARHARTIAYEIACCVLQRVPRVYLDGQEEPPT